MATHSSIPAWEIPWTEEPGGLQVHGASESRRDTAERAEQQQRQKPLSGALSCKWAERPEAIFHKGVQSESEVTQSCPTLCNPMDCSLPGSSVRGIFQARMLETFPPLGHLPHPHTEPASLASVALAGRFFTTGAT